MKTEVELYAEMNRACDEKEPGGVSYKDGVIQTLLWVLDSKGLVEAPYGVDNNCKGPQLPGLLHD